MCSLPRMKQPFSLSSCSLSESEPGVVVGVVVAVARAPNGSTPRCRARWTVRGGAVFFVGTHAITTHRNHASFNAHQSSIRTYKMQSSRDSHETRAEAPFEPMIAVSDNHGDQ